MQLPIDPTQVAAADYGEKRATLAMAHEPAVEHVREAFLDAGFGIATEFSPSKMLAEKIDADRDPYYVLGACNPEMADRALDATDEQIGGLFPCNVIVREVEPDRQEVYHVSIMRIARLLGLDTDTEAMDAIVDETGELVAEAYANLDAE
ncbi:DUF302 domain-containing protein [Halobaculum sp. MBLA0147]|uniref:DUF302 domain-containing protein n=1 Tax=Halobaculum sp. MBLA0147 TaxID=3079934 RepID=UPI0035250467